MLEEMRESGAAALLVLGADVIEDIDRHHRRGVVLMKDHTEAVGKRELGI
jgi:hypothetical protein